jgi:hypothetical protein
MTLDLTDPGISRLVVTGHPNHELAIFGFVQRLRPRLLFLTDGGGEERENESRRALASIGLLDRARFLGCTEQKLYEALLFTDRRTFQWLVDSVRDELIACDARQVFCESIELYNPLHDITLPIVRAAAAGLSDQRDVEIIEFALIAQEPAPPERYRVQRFPADRAPSSIALDAVELANKLAVRDRCYLSLRRTTGAVIDALPDQHSATEQFARALHELPAPNVDHALRYEWRGRLLKERGEVDRVITFAEHFTQAMEVLAACGAT